MLQLLSRVARRMIGLADRLGWLAPLLMRLYFGYFWAETGWGKLQNLDAFAQRFAGWGIPHPMVSAALSAYTEWIGGLLIMFGLATRVVCIPMIFNMIVAIATVTWAGVHSLDDFAEMDEALYMFIFFWLMMAGPGRASLDYLIARVVGFNSEGSRLTSNRIAALASKK